jgi:hypothetical protein
MHHWHKRAWLIGFVCAALGVVACHEPPPVAPKPTVAHPELAESPAGPRLQDQAWGIFRSKAQGLKLALPDARGWAEQSGAVGASWELLHAATGTTLSVRRWRASRLPRVDACEAEVQARTADLPVADETNLVSRREAHVPEGFVTRISLLSLPGQATQVRGLAIAVGAGVGECLSVIARTQTASKSELAERLRLLDVALGHVRLSHIEDRVPAPKGRD